MNTLGRAVVALLLAIAGILGSIALVRKGAYGLTLFLLLPTFVGGLATWLVRPRNIGRAALTGACSAGLGTVAFLAVGLEGAICVVMALPLTMPLGAMGGVLVYLQADRRSTLALLLLPMGTLGFDFTAHPPIYEVRSAIEIAAPPDRVWQHVVTFAELPEPAEWYFRAGLAYPKRARIAGTGPGAVRYCEFSTGPFVEPIEVWDQPRLLRFSVTQNPAPMHEWSPYANVLPKHLHGYMISKHGQFRLTALPGNRTLLEGATWYQHGLWPAAYWRLWSDAIIHRIHMRVLTHIRGLAEGG